MKISEFSLVTRNIAGEGATERMGEWKSGSRSNLIALGSRGGKQYQIKLHAAEPKWYNAAQAIAAKEAEIRALPSDAPRMVGERLRSELESLKNSKARNDESDRASDEYIEIKHHLADALNSIGDPLVAGPADFWKEAIEFKGGAVFAVEATPWVDGVAVGFDDSAPVQFARDLTDDEQYDIVAALAHTLSKLHAAGVLHGDLKQANTLIVKRGGKFEVALIDFDASFVLEDLYSRKYRFDAWNYVIGGTYFSNEQYELFSMTHDSPDEEWYEEYELTKVDEKSDIFSLGITIYEYFFGRADKGNFVPFVSPDGEKLNSMSYGRAVARGYTPDFPDTVNDLLYAAFNWMLAKDPAERPTAAQVEKLFASRDLSSVPAKFTRCRLWEQHRDAYRLIPLPGVTVKKGKAYPDYYIEKDGVGRTRDMSFLVSRGYAEQIGTPPPDAPVVHIDENKNKYWESDGEGTLPPCVVRGATSGRYLITVSGVGKSVDFAELKKLGIICSEAELTTPWPRDAGLRFISVKTIKRNMAVGKGPGHYIIGEGALAYKYTAEQLVANRHAAFGITFALWKGDEEKYEPNPAAFPSTVKAVMRNSITNHEYRIIYNDGHEERLKIDAMLAKGYVKLK